MTDEYTEIQLGPQEELTRPVWDRSTSAGHQVRTAFAAVSLLVFDANKKWH